MKSFHILSDNMKSLTYHLTCIFLLISAGAARAQESDALEDFFRSVRTSYMSFTCAYELEPGESSDLRSVGKVRGDAKVQLQVESYIFTGGGLVMVCDGKDVCMMDKSSKEAVYEPVPENITEDDFIRNPAYLICGLEDNFRIESSEVLRKDGEKVADRYVLMPAVECGIDRCVLDFVVWQDSLSDAQFILSDGSILTLGLTEHEMLPEKPDSYFSLPTPSSLGAEWVVTDLR